MNLDDLHSKFIKLSYIFIELLMDHTNCLYIQHVHRDLNYYEFPAYLKIYICVQKLN